MLQLPGQDVSHYTVYYTAIEHGRVEFAVEFPVQTTSNIIMIQDLTPDLVHQFQVSATLDTKRGKVEGLKSEKESIVFGRWKTASYYRYTNLLGLSIISINYYNLCRSKGISTAIWTRGALYHLAGNYFIHLIKEHDKLRYIATTVYHTYWLSLQPEYAWKLDTHIRGILARAISRLCNCTFPLDFIRSGRFSCRNSTSKATYRSAIITTASHDARQLVDFIQKWVSSRPILELDWWLLDVYTDCPAGILSFSDPECQGSVPACNATLLTNNPLTLKCDVNEK